MKTILATVGFVLSLGLSFGLTGCAGSESGEPTGATQSNIEKGGKDSDKKGGVDKGGCVDADDKDPKKPVDKKPVDKDGYGEEGADKGKTPTKEGAEDDGYGGGKTPEKPTDGSGKGEGDSWGEDDACGCK